MKTNLLYTLFLITFNLKLASAQKNIEDSINNLKKVNSKITSRKKLIEACKYLKQIGNTFFAIDNYTEAKAYYKKLQSLAIVYGDKSSEASAYAKPGSIYY